MDLLKVISAMKDNVTKHQSFAHVSGEVQRKCFVMDGIWVTLWTETNVMNRISVFGEEQVWHVLSLTILRL